MIAIFVLSALVALWPWTIYPLLVAARARIRPRPARLAPHLPPRPLSIVIVARDEAARLPAKLASLPAAGVPAEQLDVIVVDDGSRDDTAALAEAAGARVLRAGAPLGKAAALNLGVAAARHDLLVLTDARQPLQPGALAALALPFYDPRVAAVTGELDPPADVPAGPGSRYRRFEDALRRLEARSGSCVGATGALWAVRRALMPRLPEGLVLDDLYAPLTAARGGRRIVVEPEARATELADAAAPAAEHRRRLRTLAGNLQLVARAPWLLVPGKNPLFWRFLGHKLVRLAGPAALATALCSLGVLAFRSTAWAAVLGAALLALVLALAGARAGRAGALARAFVHAQGLVVLAWWHALSGRTLALWRPARGPAGADALGLAEVSHGHA